MLNKEDIKQIIDDCKDNGYDIKVRDIMSVLLMRIIKDKDIIYKSLFGIDDGVSEYFSSGEMMFLGSYLEHNEKTLIKKNKKQVLSENDISFEENKSEMIKLIKNIQEEMDNGTIDARDGYKMITDIRVKLNDKFKVNEDVKDQIVVVEHKYNDVCPFCHHEIPMPTKERCMKEHNLIDSL